MKKSLLTQINDSETMRSARSEKFLIMLIFLISTKMVWEKFKSAIRNGLFFLTFFKKVLKKISSRYISRRRMAK